MRNSPLTLELQHLLVRTCLGLIFVPHFLEKLLEAAAHAPRT